MAMTQALLEAQRRYRTKHHSRRKAEGRIRERLRGWKKFGLTVETATAALLAQGGRCAICPTWLLETETGPKGRERVKFNADHDHVTGRFRGFLCNTCNRGMGLFNDNPDHLDAAAAYLRRNSD
jgi:hypothetical protein